MTLDERLAKIIGDVQYHADLATKENQRWYPINGAFAFLIPVLSWLLTAIASNQTPPHRLRRLLDGPRPVNFYFSKQHV
jgi:hypothetical protein